MCYPILGKKKFVHTRIFWQLPWDFSNITTDIAKARKDIHIPNSNSVISSSRRAISFSYLIIIISFQKFTKKLMYHKNILSNIVKICRFRTVLAAKQWRRRQYERPNCYSMFVIMYRLDGVSLGIHFCI